MNASPLAPVRLQTTAFSLDEEMQATRAVSARIGGICSFVGCVRDFAETGELNGLHLESYERLALPVMHALRDEAMSRFALHEARLIHRLGSLPAGEPIVLTIAASEHRDACFEACRWLIDSLKKRVPIWKKEVADTGAAWVMPPRS